MVYNNIERSENRCDFLVYKNYLFEFRNFFNRTENNRINVIRCIRYQKCFIFLLQ